jgi:hypothetical protein
VLCCLGAESDHLAASYFQFWNFDIVAAREPTGEVLLRAAVDVEAVVNVEDVDNSAALVDPVDDAICAAPGAMAASSERPEQRSADTVRVARKPGIANCSPAAATASGSRCR